MLCSIFGDDFLRFIYEKYPELKEKREAEKRSRDLDLNKDSEIVADMEEAEGRMGDLSYCAEEIDGYFVKYFASADSQSQSTDVEGQSTEAE